MVGTGHGKEHAIRALFTSSEWTRPDHVWTWGVSARNLQSPLAFGLGKLRKIFAEMPYREFLNPDHLEDISATWVLACAVWHSLCFLSYHTEEAIDISTCLCNQMIPSVFCWVLVPFPNRNKQKLDRILWDRDATRVTLIIRDLWLNRVVVC